LSTADPEIIGTGVQNRVGKSSSAETVEKTETPSPVQSGGQSLGGEITITGDSQIINRTVNAKKIKVVGRSNNLHLSGAAEELEIIGASNIIKIDQVQRIRFLGSRNIVNYQNAPKPEVSQTGEGNVATRTP
jgi:hypothetical protein